MSLPSLIPSRPDQAVGGQSLFAGQKGRPSEEKFENKRTSLIERVFLSVFQNVFRPHVAFWNRFHGV